MEIQSDLIILPANNHLPLPWSVRGPLGLETGSEVSIALVHSGNDQGKLPDIIVSPLQSEYLGKTYTLEVELGERTGAVADFLSWLGDSIEIETGNKVNIVLSETITLEGRNKHKMHIVLEPTLGTALELAELSGVVKKIAQQHSSDILFWDLEAIYKADQLNPILQQKVQVNNGWLKYDGWMKRILERYPSAKDEYDLTKVVVSSNPQQRLLRFIIPRPGVIEIRVPHQNRPGALREISNVVRQAGYNILSSRLSRTPPAGFAASTSVFVAACEPLNSRDNQQELRNKLLSIDTKFMIENVKISAGRHAEKTLYLTPRRREMVQIDPDIADDRASVRKDISAQFYAKYNRQPRMFVFVSRRFIKKSEGKAHDEQIRTLKKIIEAIEDSECAAIEAADPGHNEGKYYDDYVYKAVFARLWAGDACLVLALDEHQTGRLSVSIGHEIGFFAGRNKPLKVFVTSSREQDPVFGNIVGKNRITYPDGDAAFVDDDPDALYGRVRAWLQTLTTVGDR